jgi:hypothetical protein
LDKHPQYAGQKAYNIDFFERIVTAHSQVSVFTAHRIVPNIHFSKKLNVYPITFVRHPLLRAISVYRFERIRRDDWPRKAFAQRYDFAGWIRWCLESDQLIEARNYQSCLLSINDDGDFVDTGTSSVRSGNLQLVYERLDKMPVVGVVELFGQSVAAINRAGRPMFPDLNIGEMRVNSTKVVEDWAKELSSVEQLLPGSVREDFYAANGDDLALFERYRARLVASAETLGT